LRAVNGINCSLWGDMWPFNREKKPEAPKQPRVSAHKIELTNGFYNTKSGNYECKHCKNKTPGHEQRFQKKREYNRSYRKDKRVREVRDSTLFNKYLSNTATEEERAHIDAKLKIEALKWLGGLFK